MSSPSTQTILVTGASGFIGGQVMKLAFSKGYNVRAAVRSESSGAKLRESFPAYSRQLSVAIVPDITKPELFADAFEGNVTGVIHHASPFVLQVEDNKRDLLDPAIHGAVAILEAAKRYSTKVRRVVSTSSHAAIVDLSQGWRPGYTYSENDWNPDDYEKAAASNGVVAYCASKALAEKAMWDWMKTHSPSFTLATICPPWVFGPHEPALSSTAHLNQSSALLYNLFGTKELPPFDFGGFVDVRDIAAAHIAAFERDEAAGQRFLVGSHFDWPSAANAAREAVPELQSRIPDGGKPLIDEVYAVDGSKAEKLLGIKYMSLKDSMADSFKELLAAEAAA